MNTMSVNVNKVSGQVHVTAYVKYESTFIPKVDGQYCSLDCPCYSEYREEGDYDFCVGFSTKLEAEESVVTNMNGDEICVFKIKRCTVCLTHVK